jgi:hypothetical protein
VVPLARLCEEREDWWEMRDWAAEHFDAGAGSGVITLGLGWSVAQRLSDFSGFTYCYVMLCCDAHADDADATFLGFMGLWILLMLLMLRL